MLDFTPRPAAAPALQRIWAHARLEAWLIARNAEQAILALVIPAAVLVAGRFFAPQLGIPFGLIPPSVLALVIWSTCLTSLAIATGFERRYQVLERIAATPLGKSGILSGKALAIVLLTASQLSVLTALALLLGWRPILSLAALVVAALTAAGCMVCFAGLGLAIAGTLRPEATLAVANLIYLAGMPLGILLPTHRLPEWAQPVIVSLPTAALGEALRAAAQGMLLGWPLVTAVLWAAGSCTLAWKVFTWTS